MENESKSAKMEAEERTEAPEKSLMTREKSNCVPVPLQLLPTSEVDNSITEITNESDFIVKWDEPENQDLENPRNWSSTKKWMNIATIAVIGFLV